MIVRITTRAVQPGKGAELIQFWQENMAPYLKEQKGFNAAYLVGDMAQEKIATITHWNNEADAVAAIGSAEFVRLAELGMEYSATLSALEQYEFLARA